MNIILIYFAIKYKGYFHDIYNAIKKKEFIPIDELEIIKNKIENGEIKAITIIDDEYPESLKLINNPPFVLFYEGNKELLKNDNKMILTGDFDNENINSFLDDSLNELSNDFILISNNSRGLDQNIIEKIHNKNNKLILISANGLNNPYFAKEIDIEKWNKENILIISEYPNDVNLNKRRLVQRNRLSMGLAKFIVIASSFKDSKILSLVSYALEQGKDVYCYPGLQNENDGNNLLIQDGAIMITSIKNRNNLSN